MNSRTPELIVRPYSSVSAKKIDWLWYPYIPASKITLLLGCPGDGKSMFLVHLAAALTTGTKLPDGQKVKKAMNVLYQCGEDSPEDTVKPRLLLSKADCDRIYYIQNLVYLDDIRLQKAILEAKARLAVIDPFQSFLFDELDTGSTVSRLHDTLTKYAHVASRTGCAIILVDTINKCSGRNSSRYGNKTELSGMANSILMISRDDDTPSIRYMTQVKNNLAAEGAGVSFSLSDTECLVWGKPLGKVGTEEGTPLDRAKRRILLRLGSGEVKAKEMLEELAMIGISERTARRAMHEIGVRTRKRGNAWYWIPGDKGDKG